MAFKSVLTVATRNGKETSVLTEAAALARAYDGHLDIFCLGIDRTQIGYYYAGAGALVLQETITRAANEAEELEKAMSAHMQGSDLRWTVEAGVAQMADISRSVGARARFADVVVVPRPYGEDRGLEHEGVVEGALFDGRAPVVVVPDGARDVVAPKRVAIGWDESPEAVAAVRAALPVLATAEVVDVVVIDPPVHGPNRADPGGPLSRFLSRHGLKVEVNVLSRTLPRVSDVLLRHATDSAAEMIVMGAYGHSRFREAILGGATREMLEHSEVPLFMAH